MNNFKDMWNALITSSANPKNTSLAVKAFLTFWGGYALQAVQFACNNGFACIPVDNDVLTNIINALGTVTEGGLMIVSALVLLYGLYRKWSNGRWTAAPTS